MSIQRLTKQLQREFQANRQKAVALGVLAIVAAWFWWPLLKGWFGTTSAPASAITAPAVAGNNVASLATQTPRSRSTWQELAASIDRDPRMRPLDGYDFDSHDAVRNPFQQLASEPATAPLTRQPPAPTTIAAKIDPRTLGLTVSSTLVGRRSTALISGRSFARGDVIAAGGQAFIVADISSDQVVLTAEGESYILPIVGRTESNRIELRGKSP